MSAECKRKMSRSPLSLSLSLAPLLLSRASSCVPCSGLDVVIHTWTGAKHVCRHLRQTDWEKQERKEQIPPLHVSLLPLSVFVLDPPHPPTQSLWVWMGHVTSFLLFWPRVQSASGSADLPPCLLNTIFKISISFAAPPLRKTAGRRDSGREEGLRESDWTLEELNDHALLLFMVLSADLSVCRGWQTAVVGGGLGAGLLLWLTPTKNNLFLVQTSSVGQKLLTQEVCHVLPQPRQHHALGPLHTGVVTNKQCE